MSQYTILNSPNKSDIPFKIKIIGITQIESLKKKFKPWEKKSKSKK